MEDEFVDYDDYSYEFSREVSFANSTTNLQRNNSSYQMIKSNDLEKLREIIIQEASEFTSLSRDEVIKVLVLYQWNMDKIRDQWYEDVDRNREICGIDLSKATQKLLISKNIIPGNSECGICYTSFDDTFISLSCNHFFCGDCWGSHLESKTEDILTLISSTCPQKDCTIVIPESLFLSKLGESFLEILKKAIYKNFTDNNADLKWCPSPKCGICIQSQNHNYKEVECECKAVFCFTCGKEAHRPCPCEMITTWEMKNTSESENVKWLTANTKQCPNCHKFIEKNQGCNHMTCRKEAGGCGYEFCWICMGEWKIHGTNYYNCNKFDPEKIKTEEKKQKSLKFELDKYVHYFNRYMNHQKSLLFALKMRDSIQEMIKTLNIQKMLPYDELKYLENAVETIIKSRRALKNTYIFGYYMKEVNEKKLFEHNQYLLEKDADKLHEDVEGDELKSLLKIDNHDEFNKEWTRFKSNVVNLSTVTIRYMDNLMNDIEIKMMDCIDFKSLA